MLRVWTEDLYMEMCFTMKKEPLKLKWDGLGLYGEGLRTYTCKCPTMNKQPFRLGTGEGSGVRGGD